MFSAYLLSFVGYQAVTVSVQCDRNNSRSALCDRSTAKTFSRGKVSGSSRGFFIVVCGKEESAAQARAA